MILRQYIDFIFSRLFSRRQGMTSNKKGLPEEKEFKDNLGWLIDIPLFIDKERVGQLYDLTIQPIFYEYRSTPAEKNRRELESQSGSVRGGVEAGVESSGMLNMIASGQLKGWIEGEHTETDEQENAIRYEITQTPQRRLAQIAIQYFISSYQNGTYDTGRNYHYVENPANDAPDYREETKKGEWLDSSCPSEPRDLVILELPGVRDIDADSECVPTKLVPTAAEFEDGTVVKLYQEFEERYESPPRYPEREKKWGEMGTYYNHIEDHPLKDESREQNETIGESIDYARDYYWKWFEEKFNGKKATTIVEEAAQKYGDIRWIDFRLPLNKAGYTLHLHIQPREEYNTGTFAYNLIKRGYKHGLLLVGTIKSEPDMDVLAIYER